MYQVVCTKTLDNADDVAVKVLDYEDKKIAIKCFDEKVKTILDKVFKNEFLSVKVSMHARRALIHVENAHYLVALVKDGGLFDNASFNL